MKTIVGEVLEAPPTDGEGRPVMGIVVGSLGALALWAGILALISLIV